MNAVHLDRGDGRARCGTPNARLADGVTCLTCLNLADGTHAVGNRWYDVKPCGTPAAYRRHLRRHGKPVRCESCLQAGERRQADRRARIQGDAGTYRRAV